MKEKKKERMRAHRGQDRRPILHHVRGEAGKEKVTAREEKKGRDHMVCVVAVKRKNFSCD